jgi:NAD(P)-dependent dehydrogenase (short-subunit alcohol dehydrogenase family)
MSKSKHIVLTGATRGLGRALLRRFLEAGHTVSGCGRQAGLVEELRRSYGPPHRFAVVDVANEDEVRRWADEVLTQLGPPDLLINNAAVINRLAPLWKISAQEFDRLMAVNVNGPANVIRAFVPSMVERRSGVIVNLSSGWGRSTSPEVAPYCASKYAIEGLTLALAQELPAGMAAIPVNPGIIDTDMLRSCFGAGAASYPNAERWAEKVAPWMLQLGPQHNGQSLTAPGG